MPRQTLQIPLEFNNQTFNTLIDSGAMGLYMDTRLVQKLKLSSSYSYQSLQCGQYQEHWRKNSTSGQYSILHLQMKATFNVPNHNVGQAGSDTQTSVA